MIKITIFYFIISLFFGMMILYVFHPRPQVILKYTSIDNISKVKFKDNEGNCYNYEKKEISCESN